MAPNDIELTRVFKKCGHAQTEEDIVVQQDLAREGIPWPGLCNICVCKDLVKKSQAYQRSIRAQTNAWNRQDRANRGKAELQAAIQEHLNLRKLSAEEERSLIWEFTSAIVNVIGELEEEDKITIENFEDMLEEGILFDVAVSGEDDIDRLKIWFNKQINKVRRR